VVGKYLSKISDYATTTLGKGRRGEERRRRGRFFFFPLPLKKKTLSNPHWKDSFGHHAFYTGEINV